jgi:hypothetical protein
METVRSHSWGRFVFPPSEEAVYRKAPNYRGFLEEAHTGFEPVSPANAGASQTPAAGVASLLVAS